MDNTNIAVIGAGIIGSAIALELAISGYNVEVLSSEADADQATPGSFGWINAHGPENHHHFKIRLESMALWRALKSAYPALPTETITALDLDLPQFNIDQTQDLYSKFGHTTRLMTDKDLENEYPDINLQKTSAIVSDTDMVADPRQIAKFIRSRAEDLGATFSDTTPVNSIYASDTEVTISAGSQTRTFDQVVIAAGTGSQRLVEQLGHALPMKNSRGILLTSVPQEKHLHHLISAPDLHCWQMSDGRILAGSTQAGSDPDSDVDALKRYISIKLGELVPEFHGIEFPDISIGTRPQPLDGMPVIDIVNDQQNIHLAVMHSGMTLAPFAAKAIAHQVKTRLKHDASAPYSISRFQKFPEEIAI